MMNNQLDTSIKRIGYIDLLKFIRLTGIILAHVGSPGWIMMVRSFDVPLMVILSSMLANKSFAKYKTTNNSISKYYISRIKRLVIPTWIFLFIYFILAFLVGHKAESLIYYIASFSLTRYGIGYVWIILIYLYSAIMIPMFAKIKFSYKSNIIICILYVLYEIAYYYKIGLGGSFFSKIIETTIYYIIPYGVLTYLGYNYNSITKKAKIGIAITSLLIFVILAVYYYLVSGKPELVQIAKYPPRLYFISYGIACSFVLLLLCENVKIMVSGSFLFSFISSHSMWIYLWHILVIAIYEKFKLPELWYIKFLLVYAGAIVIVVLVNRVIDLFEKKHIISLFKYLKG